MDPTGLRIQDVITLSSTAVAELPLHGHGKGFTVPRGSTLTFVGRRIDLAGAVFTGYHVVIVADEVTGNGISLRQHLVGPDDKPGQVGIEGPKGMNLTVLCRSLNAGGSITVGGQGGRGLPGPPTTDRPEDAPLGNDGKPTEGEQGFKGHRGLRGAPSGPGGDIVVQAITDLRAGQSVWTRQFGPGGSGGEGGPGGPGGSGAPEGKPGPKGDPGPTGLVRPSVTVKTGPIPADSFVRRLDELRVRPQWTSFRVRMAEMHAHSAEYGAAVTELDAAQAIAPVPAITAAIRQRLQDFVTAVGLERDLGLIPDIETYSARGRSARRRLGNALFEGSATAPLASVKPDTLHLVAGRLANYLADVMTSTSTLGLIESDARTRAELAAKTLSDSAKLLADVRNRLSTGTFSPPNLTLPGEAQPEDRVALVGSIEALFAPPRGALLPAAVDLLVPPQIGRGTGAFQPDRSALKVLRGSALGLSQRSLWPTAGNQAPARAVDLVAVAGDLRRASGDPALRDLVVELFETLHGQRLAQLRQQQALSAQTGFPALQERVQTALAELQQLAVPPVSVSAFAHGLRLATFVRPLRVIVDLLSWHTQQEHRALDLFTLGKDGVLVGTGPIGPILGPIQLNFPDSRIDMFFDPGAEDDARNLSKLPFLFHDAMLRQATEQSTTGSIGSYFSRGIPFDNGDAPSMTVKFEPGHPAFTRFIDQGVMWFDLSVADLAGPLGAGPHAEIKVVGARVRLNGVTSRDSESVRPFTVQVTHSGFAVQKDLGGGLYRQIALPALVDVELKPAVEGELPPPDVPILCQGGTLVEDFTTDDPAAKTVKPLAFAAYGRGAAAGWSLQYRGGGNASLDFVTGIEIDIAYTAMVERDRATLRAVRMAGTTLDVGTEALGLVELTAPAKAPGFRVDLRSTDPAVLSMPPSVVVPAGSSTAEFTFRALKSAGVIPPTVFATGQDGMGRRSLLPVRKPSAAARLNSRIVPKGHGIGALLVTAGRAGKVVAPVLIAATNPPRPADNRPFPPGKIFVRGLDLAGTTELTVGPEPRALAADPVRRRLYVLDGKVTMFDLDTMAKMSETPPQTGLTDLVIDANAGLLYVAQYLGDRIDVLEADDLSVVAQISSTEGLLDGVFKLAVDEGRRMVYALCSPPPAENLDKQATITRISRSVAGSHTVNGSMPIGPLRLAAQDLALDASENRLYVANQGNVGVGVPSLTILRATSLSNLRTVPLRSPARAVVVGAPGSDIAYVATQSGLVMVNGAEAVAGPLIPTETTVFTAAADPTSGVVFLGDFADGTVTRVVPPAGLPVARWQ